MIIDAREMLVKATGGKYSVLAEERLWYFVAKNGKTTARKQTFAVSILTVEDESVFCEQSSDLQALVGYAIRAVAVYEAMHAQVAGAVRVDATGDKRPAAPFEPYQPETRLWDEDGLDDARDIDAEINADRRNIEEGGEI